MKRLVLAALMAVLFTSTAGASEFLPPYLEGAQVQSLRLRIETFERSIADHLERVEYIVKEKRAKETTRIEDTYQKVVDALQLKERKRRAALIKRMEIFLERHPDSKLISESMLRLGELYFERANDDFIDAMERFERRVELAAQGKIDEEPVLPGIDYTASIDLYKRFVDRFPTHEKLAEALYLLGYTLQEDYRGDEAYEVYLRLLRERPDSFFVPEVHFRLGEFLFEIGEFKQAVHEYQATMDTGDEMLYDKALYKMGWTYYRMNDIAKANKLFIDVVDYADDAETASAGAMRKEAIKYIGISFSDEGGIDGLEKFVEKIGGRPYEIELFLGFADVLYDQTRYTEAIDAYVHTVNRFPLFEKNPSILIKVMETHQKLANLEGAFAVRDRLVSDFGPASDWYAYYAGTATRPARNAKLANETRELTEGLQYDYAKYWHAKAQAQAMDAPAPTSDSVAAAMGEIGGTAGEAGSVVDAEAVAKARQTYDKAAEAYARFLRLFPESTRGAEVGFLLAEILYAQQNWPQAGARYRGVTRDLVNPNNKFFADAAWNMVLSYRNWLEDYEKSPQGRRTVDYYKVLLERGGEPVTETTLKAKIGPPPAMPNEAGKLIEASRYFMELFPQSERNPLLVYSDGQILLRYGQNAAARHEFLRFIERYGGNELVFDALKNIVITFTLERQYSELNKYAYEVLDGNLGRKTEIADYLGGILSGSIFKDARSEEEKGNRLRAAAIYQDMVGRFPKSKFAADALFNAGLNIEKEGKYFEAIRIFKRLLDEYPDSKHNAKAVFLIAKNNERVLNYLGAVKYYLMLAREFPKEKEGADAMYNSALLLEKLGEPLRAAEVYLEYVRTYPERDDVAEVLFFAADAFYRGEEWAKAAAVYENYVRGDMESKKLAVEASYKWAMALENMGEPEKSRQRLIATTKLYLEEKEKGEKNAPRFGAHGAFLAAMDEYREYEAIKLELPVERMAKLLEKKATELKKMVGSLTNIVAFGDPHWGSAALFMIGESYQGFANALFEAPVPPELDEMEAEIYRFELQDQAFPIEDKALQAFQKQLSTALSAGIENEWTEKTRARLRKLNPNLERAKGNETIVLGRNEFFYRFGPTTERTAEYEIRDGQVVYAGQAKSDAEEERIELTRAQNRILKSGASPFYLLSGDGAHIEAPKERAGEN